VGTDKRARQKSNRTQRQIQEAQAAKASAVKRNAVRWGVALVAAFAAVVLIAWIGGAFSGDDEPGLATTDSIAPTLPPVVTSPASAPATTAATSSVECPPTDGSAEQVREFPEAPPMCIDSAKSYTAEIVTNKGTLTVDLFADRAPLTVNNFVTLARYKYFDGIDCHRIIPGFMAQCGDPTGSGSGGPGYQFADELPQPGEYQIGSLAMANSGPGTNGSQFFVITGDAGVSLQPNYSLFGQVTGGLDDTVPALDAAGNPDPTANGVPPAEQVTIESVTITEA
jgi:cyclophilin family peptidyl-prolyl cis-trans isomerase